MVKRISFFLFLTVLLLIPAVSIASKTKITENKVKEKIAYLSIPFIENTGQMNIESPEKRCFQL